MILNRRELFLSVCKEFGYDPESLTAEQETEVDQAVEILDNKFWDEYEKAVAKE